MQPHRLLGWAFAASITVHVVALIAPGWRLPETPEPPLRIDAKLLQMPAPPPVKRAPKPPAPAAPGPTSKVVAAASASAASVAQGGQSSSESSSMSSASSEAAAESAPLAEGPSSSSSSSSSSSEPALAIQTDWPHKGCIGYVLNVTYGILNGDLGHAEQCWQHDDSSYSASLKGRAAVAWRELLLEQRSSGRVAGGLPISEQFDETVDKRSYQTLFDPNASAIHQNRNGDPREVPTGGVALDMLALMQFLSLQPDDREAFDVFVVASRGMVSRVTVVQQEPGEVKLPGGTVMARRYRAEARGGELRIDVWISRQLRNAPVRFRIVNKGDIFDFLATDVTLDDKQIMRAPPPPPKNPADDSN